MALSSELSFGVERREILVRSLIVVWGVVGLGGVAGCEEPGSAAGYEQTVMQERVQRDMQMREKNSVLAPNLRDDFKGLDHYAVDSTYRFVVPLRTRSSPDTVMLPETTGRVRGQVRLGTVTVPLPSGEEQLTVFKGEGDDPRGRLWIAFADATNGDETYKAGRYVDLIRDGDDSVVVDFNRAYNPTCVYNPEYACPLPPAENEIGAPIPAGEKTPKFGRAK
ncbi:MAG: hypothetical protein BRD55_10110 [Bacteroidetes bacterium SW_9_63_38]|nr:MAG: hypothetical protein BRD55_10110 [Bacteroidetes bacterium SW_9_63_38]